MEHFGLKSLQDLPNISEIKSLVENSVRREELLRTEKVISADENKDENKSEDLTTEVPAVDSAENEPADQNQDSSQPQDENIKS